MALFTAATAEQVRAVLGLGLSVTEIGDDVIGMSVYAGAAEAELLRRDPLASGYTTDPQLGNAQRALVYLIAARLVPALPAVLSEQLGDYRYQMQATDATKEAARLQGLADEAIAANLTDTGFVSPIPSFFTVAGRRGQ